MAAITSDQLQRRIEHDPRQRGTPFEQQRKTLARIEADPTLYICPTCEGEQGYITILGLYTGCWECNGRGVRRRFLAWITGRGLPMPPSFYDEN